MDGQSDGDHPHAAPSAAPPGQASADSPVEGGLQRNLKARHINLIAIGGAIGTGLFVGTGASISAAGLGGAIGSYGVIGIAIYFIMAAPGEVAIPPPVDRAFGP